MRTMSSRRRQQALPPSPEEGQDFIKIIVSTVFEDLKLPIPPSFMEKYGTKLSSHVILRVPNNGIWEVKLIKDNSEIWLHKEFIEFYSIKYGHVFLFKYKGDSEFNLVIFDMTASEIKYPPPQRPKSEDVSQLSEEDNSVEIIGATPSSNKRKIIRRNLTRSLHKSLGGEIEINQKNKDKSIKESDETNTKTAIERAKNLNTINPKTFVTVHSTHMASMSIVSNGFVEMYMVGSDGEMIKELTLEMASDNIEGRSKQWKVKCLRKEKEIIIYWLKFVEENHVKLGDVCAFEYLKDGDIDVKVFRVHIIRG